jgi:hypothetical protein
MPFPWAVIPVALPAAVCNESVIGPDCARTDDMMTARWVDRTEMLQIMRFGRGSVREEENEKNDLAGGGQGDST